MYNTKYVDNISHSISIYDEKNNLSIKRIIQIIGKGHSKKNNNVAENSKIQNNDNDNLLIHEFDATTEDPFTLESFDTLIQQHSEKDKDFIIARVTTVDPTDELKSYHSYYSGHHINKVLFRTQPDQGLLHRMKAKNPLNNMNIIGDVHYYVVKASSVKKLPTFTKSSSMSTTSKKTLRVNGESTIMATSSLDKVEKGFAIEMESTSNNKRWSADDSLKPLPKAITANHNSSTSVNNEISVSISHNDLKEQQIDSPITLTQSPTKDSHSISINEEEGVEDGTIYYKAKFYATDDDFLMHSVIRHFFKANALEPMDAQLFTINTSSHNNPNVNVTPSARLERIVTGHETYLLDPMVIGNMRPPVARSIDSNELNAVPTSRWRRALNNMRMNKGLRWLVLMYMIFGFLLIRFVVAETYAYLMAFLLMLCLFLVFCVGSGVGIWGR
ncbi:4494_t:CDS:2 [Rhizophagus irregularis]|nr:4494_t:CDS:2 [Rhizophagus irregularis]